MTEVSPCILLSLGLCLALLKGPFDVELVISKTTSFLPVGLLDKGFEGTEELLNWVEIRRIRRKAEYNDSLGMTCLLDLL